MANEFIARNGIIALNNTQITGSLAASSTVTAGSFSGAGTGITGLTNSNLSGTAGITNANLANSSVTINGSAVSLGGSTTVTATATNALTIGTGLSGTSYNGSTPVTIANTGVLSVTTNTGLSTNTSATGNVTITNTGVTSNVASTGISVSGATGAVTITNTGVTSAVAGTGVSVSGATGAVTISIGQAVGTGNSPTFAALYTTGNIGAGTSTLADRLVAQGGNIAKYTTTGVDGTFDNMIKYGYFSDLNTGAATAARWVGIDCSVTAGAAISNVLRIRAYSGGTGNAAPVNVADFRGDQTSYFYSTVTSAADIVAYSDRRIKENIETITGALEKVTRLRGVTYTRVDLEDKTEKMGVIAQETQEVIPQVVLEGTDGILSVAYGNMSGLFIEAFKEQQTLIYSQQAQIDELKVLVNTLLNK